VVEDADPAETPSTEPEPVPNDGSIGTVLDLGPGPIDEREPAPCIPLSSGAVGSIVVLDQGHGCLRVLVGSEEPVGAEVTWSPDGSWLLATINFHVVRVAADGSWRQDLGGGGQAETASLSPDGSRLALTGNVPCCYLDQRRVIVVANSDGSGAEIVHYDTGTTTQTPVWSRDSQRFAYVNKPYVGTYADPEYLHVRTRDGSEIAVRSFEGRGGLNLNTNTYSPALIGRPEWLADGTLVTPVFMEQPVRQSLYWYNGDLSDAPGPGNPESMSLDRVASSPDAGQLIYDAHDPDNGQFVSQLRLLNRADGTTRLLVREALAASWSPSGTRFAYAALDPAAELPTPKTIMIGQLDGAATALWTPDHMNCTCWLYGPPLWSPDGGQLAIATH
jgi:hypothetical protein